MSRLAGDRIGQQLQTISITTRAVEQQLGAALRINLTDLAAMEQLIAAGPLTPTDLAIRLKLTTAGTTQVIDRLERAGHASRERQTGDKRRVLVTAVPASAEQVFAHLAPMLGGLDGLVADLADSERSVIESFLSRVIAVYAAAIVAPSSAP